MEARILDVLRSKSSSKLHFSYMCPVSKSAKTRAEESVEFALDL